MFRAYLGGLTSGRLGRLAFLGFWLLSWVLFALYGLGLAFAIGLTEPLLFEGPLLDRAGAAQDFLAAHYGPLVLGALALFMLLFLFAQSNLVAKRIRDMGLPGWTVLLLLALASGALAYLLPPGGALGRLENQVNGGLNGLFVLALLLIPGGLFGRKSRPEAGEDTASAGPGDSSAASPSASVEGAPGGAAAGEPAATGTGSDESAALLSTQPAHLSEPGAEPRSESATEPPEAEPPAGPPILPDAGDGDGDRDRDTNPVEAPAPASDPAKRPEVPPQ